MQLRSLLAALLAAPILLVGCSESAPTSPELTAPLDGPEAHLANMQAEYGVALLDDGELESLGFALTPSEPTAAKSGGSISGSSNATYLGVSGGVKHINLSASTTYSQNRNAASYYVDASYRTVGAALSCSNTPQEFDVEYGEAYNNGGTVTVSQGASWTGTVKWEVVGTHYALIIGGGGSPFTTSDSYCG